MTELLAPAGSLDALQAAVNAGADAVYIGGRMFGARAYADNPDMSGLLEGIEYCHLRGKKIYLTVNTLCKEQELKENLVPFLEPLYERGVDALIIQDLGVLRFLRMQFPDLELHASTQMSVTTPEGASWLKTLGIRRVVPARELSLREVQAIVQSGMEVETFVHGAMCYCYSGRCLFSSILGGRSGNRGRCAQPCRLPYTAEGESACLLSLKDMCTLDFLPELIDAGITSFKIEGRMKPPQYSAGVTSVYRKYIDLYTSAGQDGYRVSKADRKILSDLFDRGGFSNGYYFVKNGPEMLAKKQPDSQDAQSAQLKNERNRQFLSGNSKIKINGDLRIYPDTPVILSVWLSGQAGSDCSRVQAVADIPQMARTNPATLEDVSRQIRKTGNTPFEFDELRIALADGLFLPVRMLNDLRRDALDMLTEKVLMLHHPRQLQGQTEPLNPPAKEAFQEVRSQASEREGISVREQVENSAEERFPRYNFLVTTFDQLNAVWMWLNKVPFSSLQGMPDTIYLDSMLLGTKSQLEEHCRILLDRVAGLKSMHLKCIFVCPPVLRESGRWVFEQMPVIALLEQMDGFLVQTVDELSLLKEVLAERTDASRNWLLAAEDCLYAFNCESKALLRAEGVTRFTVPAELNARELSHMDLSDCELVVYGRQALMQSAQCVRKNTSGCNPDAGALTSIKDRKHVRFPVMTRCLFCTNTIYNSVPLQLGGYMDEIRSLSPSFLRLAFTVETEEETLKILDDYLISPGNHNYEKGTRGHFKRGVE